LSLINCTHTRIIIIIIIIINYLLYTGTRATRPLTETMGVGEIVPL